MSSTAQILPVVNLAVPAADSPQSNSQGTRSESLATAGLSFQNILAWYTPGGEPSLPFGNETSRVCPQSKFVSETGDLATDTKSSSLPKVQPQASPAGVADPTSPQNILSLVSILSQALITSTKSEPLPDKQSGIVGEAGFPANIGEDPEASSSKMTGHEESASTGKSPTKFGGSTIGLSCLQQYGSAAAYFNSPSLLSGKTSTQLPGSNSGITRDSSVEATGGSGNGSTGSSIATAQNNPATTKPKSMIGSQLHPHVNGVIDLPDASVFTGSHSDGSIEGAANFPGAIGASSEMSNLPGSDESTAKWGRLTISDNSSASSAVLQEQLSPQIIKETSGIHISPVSSEFVPGSGRQNVQSRSHPGVLKNASVIPAGTVPMKTGVRGSDYQDLMSAETGNPSGSGVTAALQTHPMTAPDPSGTIVMGSKAAPQHTGHVNGTQATIGYFNGKLDSNPMATPTAASLSVQTNSNSAGPITVHAASSSGRVSGLGASVGDASTFDSANRQTGRDANSGDNPAKFSQRTEIPAVSAFQPLPKNAVSFGHTLSSVSHSTYDTQLAANTPLIGQSILREVRLLNQDGKAVVNMKLAPESLGSVVVQVASEGGKISAQFNVRTPDARAYLEASVPEIKQFLQTNGITVAHVAVSLSGGDSRSGHPQYRETRQQQKFSSFVPTETDESFRSFGYNTMEMKV